jgi:lactate dehydrogenase-like 2-hydroxyacid dehydrogenase
MPKVYVTRTIPDAGLALLKAKKYDVVVNPDDRVHTTPELIAVLAKEKPDALLSLLTDKIDAAVLEAAGPQLKIVANYAVGFDNVDLAAAKAKHIAVTNTPSAVVSDSVAEHTFALILALAHRVVESDGFARAGRYHGWDPNLMVGTLLVGKTIGVIGLGRIGAGVVTRAVKGMGMRAMYYDLKPNLAFEQETGAIFETMEKVLAQSDVVSVHVPLMEKTRHLISTPQLALMKPTAYLVNTARGPIVDEKAVLQALTDRKIAGFATDVFECEPSIDCDPTDHLELKAMPNVILTPHTASATVEARQDMSRIAAENIIAVLGGQPPINPAA